MGVETHAFWAENNAYELGRDQMGDRAGGVPEPTTNFAPSLLHRNFGDGRMQARLSAISDGARRRYGASSRHRSSPYEQQGESPLLQRQTPDFGGNLIKWILFGSRIMKLAHIAIRGKVSALPFWHILSGYEDFARRGSR